MTNEFRRDLDFTMSMRRRWLEPYLYDQYSFKGRYVIVDKSRCSTLLQKMMAVDTIMQVGSDASLCIEEKIERWPGYKRRNFFLETDSCTLAGRTKPGWMHYAEADYLLYAFETATHDGLDVYFLPFQPLKAWFWQHYTEYRARIIPQWNRTKGRIVPIRDVVEVLQDLPGFRHFLITAQGIQPVAEAA